ncbi:MAG: VWA domain-containing protein [Bryobacteraceae bacterium]
MTPFIGRAVVLAMGLIPVACPQDVTFKQDVRLVEIYATVFDHGGRTVQGLTRDQFEIRDDGVVQPVRVFEASDKSLSCALLLDTTGSMREAIPALRNATREFIDALRPEDSVGIYGFSDHLEELSEMGTDRAASRRAITRIRAEGRTALFDSISQLAIALQNRPGKKVMVVLTDGGDNASVLNSQTATERARKAGIPVFAVAEGDALHDVVAEKLLHELSEITGGHAYKVNHYKDIDAIFTSIAGDLQNGYLLAFRPAAEGKKASWHELHVSVKDERHSFKIRARTGYSLD